MCGRLKGSGCRVTYAWGYWQPLATTLLSGAISCISQSTINAKFHTFITYLYTRNSAKGHAFIFNFNKVNNFYAVISHVHMQQDVCGMKAA